MPSPFPGMDPYLEGPLWPDVHHRLASEISRRLAPRLRPHYVARIEVTVVQDTSYASEIGIMYPDVSVLRSAKSQTIHDRSEATHAYATNFTMTPWGAIPPAPLVLQAPDMLEFRQATVEVRHTDGNKLVTTIEIISPVNKREPGLSAYRHKRTQLRSAGVHLLEIDLIRRATRPIDLPRLPQSAYLASLARSFANQIELWPLRLQDALPILPVPLRSPDPDVPLELGAALATIYDEAAYDLSIDYSVPPPPPPLSDEDAAWLQTLLEKSTTP